MIFETELIIVVVADVCTQKIFGFRFGCGYKNFWVLGLGFGFGYKHFWGLGIGLDKIPNPIPTGKNHFYSLRNSKNCWYSVAANHT